MLYQTPGVPSFAGIPIDSCVVPWIFAKSIANASDLSFAFGLTGSIGYAIYYLSFVVAGITIYFCGRAADIARCRTCWSRDVTRSARN
jgi:hypothetical protein